jgi:uncharacterized protein (DUF362 family)
MVAVAITHDLSSIERAIERAFAMLPLQPLIERRLVAVKPNETWASPEDISGVTQADTLRAVLRTLRGLVGHPAMIATGPLGGHAVETGLVIASTDPLAADVVGARLLGFDIQGVRHLWEARRLGIGEGDVSRMEFPGLSVREAIEAFTEAAYGEKLTFEHA